MIKIAVVEDDLLYVEKIKEYINIFMREKNISISLDIFTDGNKIVFSYEPIYDIILMDIEMPGMDGITAAENIRKTDADVILIFITNMAQYAIDGYRVRARSYILKPVNYYSFAFELQEAIEAAAKKTDDFLLITGEEGLQKIRTGDIYYVESQKHHMYIHTKNGVISIRETMKNMENKLKEFYFERCNVSYLVNLAHVSSILKDCVVVEKDYLAVSRQKRKSFVAALTKYLGGGSND